MSNFSKALVACALLSFDFGQAKPKYPEDIPADSSEFWVSKINEGTPGGPLAPNGQLVEIHYTGTLLNGV